MKNLIFLLAVVMLFACSKQGGVNPQRGKHNQTIVAAPLVAVTNDPIQQWGLQDIQADVAWANSHIGSNDVFIVLIDEKVNVYDTDLQGNLDISKTAIFRTQQNGDLGIGTNLAGIIGAVHDNGTGTAGVCNKVSIINAVTVAGWSAWKYQMTDAIKYAIQLKKSGVNVVAIQNAWDWYNGVDSLMIEAIKEAGANDILYVRAAGWEGNNVDGQDIYPEVNLITLANVISTGAYNQDGTILATSHRGYVNLYAPGEWSTFVPCYIFGDFSTPGKLTGTPVAASFVTGAVALYKASHPTATASEIKTALLNSVVNGHLNVSTF